MVVTRCVEVVLTIPDNEARTALTTLQRLGVPTGGLERADVYRCTVEAAESDRLVAALRELETVYNPNKHALRIRPGLGPQPGEVWVADSDAPGARTDAGDGDARIGSRRLPGLEHVERFVAWRVLDLTGAPGEPELVRAATQTLLCNPAFQKAMTAR